MRTEAERILDLEAELAEANARNQQLLSSTVSERVHVERVRVAETQRDAAIARAREAEDMAGYYKSELLDTCGRASKAEKERDEARARLTARVKVELLLEESRAVLRDSEARAATLSEALAELSLAVKERRAKHAVYNMTHDSANCRLCPMLERVEAALADSGSKESSTKTP